MAYWLVKSEPGSWSWDQQVRDKTTAWTGVRNFQASANLKAMKNGEQVFFYHSGEGKEIVGIAEVIREYYPDHTDAAGKFGMVDLKAVRALERPVTLAGIKADPDLKDMVLVKNSRLSVQPVTQREWRHILKLAKA